MSNYTPMIDPTLDDVAPRLRQFTNDLINQLRLCGIEIKTTNVYLLNSTDHPIEVPCEGNGVRINMNFDAILPPWASEPRARLFASFNDSRRFYCSERGKQNAKFSMKKVLSVFLSRIAIEERKQKLAEEKEQRETKSIQAFAELADTLGICSASDPDVLQKGNVKIERLPPKSTKVAVTLIVPHNQVPEIIEKYLKV